MVDTVVVADSERLLVIVDVILVLRDVVPAIVGGGHAPRTMSCTARTPWQDRAGCDTHREVA